LFARASVVAVLVTAAVTAIASHPADAATGDPSFTGGQTVAPYVGNADPAASSNGTDTLVVWEKRAGQGGRSDIYGRLTSTDTTTIEAPFRISQGAEGDYDADVAWNGSSWLVVWSKDTSSSVTVLRGRRVSKDGALLGSELAIAAGSGSRFDPAVAAGANGQFLVVWEDSRGGVAAPDIYARRVTSAGQLQDGTGLRLSDTTGFPSQDGHPDVAWNGQRYLVVWEATDPDNRSTSIYDASVLPRGVVEPSGLVVSADSGTERYYSNYAPAVAATGTTFLVVWSYEDPAASGERNLYGALLAGTGSQQPTRFAISKAADHQSEPTIAFNGYFLVVWQDRRNGSDDLWGARIGSNGTVQDPNGFLVTEYHPVNTNPALTKGSSKAKTFTFAWQARPGGQDNGIVAYGIGPAPK
jgi:hypothetical protein